MVIDCGDKGFILLGVSHSVIVLHVYGYYAFQIH